MPSANDFTTRALRMLNVVAAGETPVAADISIGYTALNDLIDAWATDHATIYEVVRSEYDLVSGTSSYTIGSGATFNQVRPLWIQAASIIPDDTAADPQEVPLGPVLTLAEYQRIPVKTTDASSPVAIYYDYDYTSDGYGRIYVYPVPNVSTCRVVLYTPTPVTQFTDQTTSRTFPPGYAEALELNLALKLTLHFAAPVPDRLERMAIQALGRIKRANFRPRELNFDVALIGTRGRFDVVTGH